MMSRAFLTSLVAVAVAGFTVAQQPKPAPANAAAAKPAIPATATALLPPSQPGDLLHIKTNVGSFKMLPKGKDLPAGRLEFSFTGTVLFTGIQPGSFFQVTGNVREEYRNDKHQKRVFFGTGKIIAVGKWANCQWFGRKLDLTFKGSTIMRLIGEYDRQLSTGEYWIDNGQKQPLTTYIKEIGIPMAAGTAPRAMTREEFEKLKGRKRTGG